MIEILSSWQEILACHYDISILRFVLFLCPKIYFILIFANFIKILKDKNTFKVTEISYTIVCNIYNKDLLFAYHLYAVSHLLFYLYSHGVRLYILRRVKPDWRAGSNAVKTVRTNLIIYIFFKLVKWWISFLRFLKL